MPGRRSEPDGGERARGREGRSPETRGLEGQGARSIRVSLGLARLAWMEMSSKGSGLPPLGDRANPEALPTLAAQAETKS